MPREILGHVTDPPASLGSRKWYTVPLSLIAHVALLVPLVLVPLMAADIIPTPREYNVFVPPAILPTDPPRPIAPRRQQAPRANANAAPIETPTGITPEPVGFEPLTDPIGDAIDGAVPGGGSVIVAEPAPAPPATQKPREPIRVGGNISPPQRTREVAPVYPPIAQAARVAGIVILEATIDTNGRVQDLRVLRSVPLLDQAAIDAVRQWEYTPTLLNGVPVPVIMTVTVNFSLTK